MEAGEGSIGNVKRQRPPLSDSEDNIHPGTSDGSKRRRLQAAGQENQSPIPACSEQETPPDRTNAPPTGLQVQQLNQSQDDEFNHRLERFKDSITRPQPTSKSPNSSLRPHSDFLCEIQQKLQDTATPSSKQASRIRQEREQELSQLQFQPVRENAWLKRSGSLTQVMDPPGSSTPSCLQTSIKKAQWPPLQSNFQDTETPSSKQASRIRQEREQELSQLQFQPVRENAWLKRSSSVTQDKKPPVSSTPSCLYTSVRRAQWPPVQSWRLDDEAGLRDGSFTEEATAGPAKQPNNEDVCVAPDASTQLPSFDCHKADELQMLKEESEHRVGFIDKVEHMKSQYDGIQTVLQLSFSEDTKLLTNTQGLQESRNIEVGESGYNEQMSDEEAEGTDDESMTGTAELSSEEQIRTWRYPVSEVEREKRKRARKQENIELQIKESEIEAVDSPDTTPHLQPNSNQACVNAHEFCEDAVQISRQNDEVSAGKIIHQENECTQDVESQGTQTVCMKDGLDLNLQNVDSVISITLTDEKPNTEDTIVPKVGLYELQGNVSTQNQTVLEENMDVELAKETKEGGVGPKKVTFILEPELINTSVSSESRSLSDAEQSETSTAKMIDEMFEEVLKYAESSGHQNPENELSPSEREKDEEAEQKDDEFNNGDELLTFPSSGILSPLSKSVEAVVKPVPLMDSFECSSSHLDFEEENSPNPLESAPLYSIDAYRSQRQSKLPSIQSLTPALQRRVMDKSIPQSSVNIKEKISALNEEAGKLQNVINQTLQALSCCTDETHGRGSLEEAEAEKLLLVSCEKRSALLAEVARLREERSSESVEPTEEELVSLKPCRGTVTISNIQLPLKVDFVCSSQSHPNAGRPSHYFFILIRYGPRNIVATPLATAADAQNGDTISFPTTVTLKDIRSTFEIDVEVYSLLPTASSNLNIDRASARSRMTPRRLLNKITISSNTQTSPAIPTLSTRHSSNFSLVGSHKITLASLGHKKFPLDKMKLEGKIRKLLGEEFQDKVPFLSPLEGNVYLRLESEGHSNVQHEGFLTRFEIVSGYGLWNRRYFVLEGCNMYYWDHPNDREAKEAKGQVSLANSSYQSVRPVKRDSCIRPFTFELVINKQLPQDHSKDTVSKCWFSADTKQERLDWMEKQNQALLDVHTWNRTCPVQTESQSDSSNNGNLRESIL